MEKSRVNRCDDCKKSLAGGIRVHIMDRKTKQRVAVLCLDCNFKQRGFSKAKITATMKKIKAARARAAKINGTI